MIHGRHTLDIRTNTGTERKKEGRREGEYRNGIISGVRCVCVRACVKAAVATAVEAGKGGYEINRKQGSKAKRKRRACPLVLTQA